MALWAFQVAAVIGVLAFVVVCIDFGLRARAAWRRRRHAQGGVYGVVLDRTGSVIGTYVDPMQTPRRATRVHGPGNVWTGSNPGDPTGWAWEGQGATEEEARFAANRLRHFYLSLLPELSEGWQMEDDGVGNSGGQPWS